jgi:hypothetical protein
MMKKLRAFTAVCLVLAMAGAAISVPYEVDLYTLHLYHFDGDTLDSVTVNPIHLALDSGAKLVDATIPGMGQVLYTWEGTASTNVNLPSAMATPEKAVSNFVGPDGAFTFEALVCPYYGLGAMPNNMQIISGEHNSARGWQFRVEAAGNLAFINLTGTIQTILTPLPKDGPHAFAANKWFHVAVAYNGQAGAAGNLKFYWTAVESGQVQAVELGSFTMNADITPTVAPFFVIGNEGRNGNGRTENWEGWIDEVRISSIAREPSDMAPFVMAGKAVRPSPANGATDIPQDSILSWIPGDAAKRHDIYLGTSAADVAAADRSEPLGVLVSESQEDVSFDPGLLALGQVYFWRVDEVQADSTIHKGDVWSFAVEPYSYPIASVTATASSSNPNMGPENTVNGSGLNAADEHSVTAEQMWLSNKAGPEPTWIQFEFDSVYRLDKVWVWNSNQILEPMIGFGAKDVAIEYSQDGVQWTSLGQVVLARASGMATYTPESIDLGGVLARFVKMTMGSNWGGIVTQYGLSEVRFFQVPVRARGPMPASGATGVGLDGLLTWRPGREAASHRVYLSTDEQAVVDGTAPAQTLADNSFDPGDLTLGTTYYWKVNEVNQAATPSVWEGDVWSFTTREYLVIDDMESYTDDEGRRIYETWIDGLANGTNGSIVGYMEAPFAERTIVHGGRQSLPLEYNNAESPFFSEAEREFSPAQNWTLSGADTLSLWVRGAAVASAGDALQPTDVYMTVQDSAGKTATATNPTVAASTGWTQWKIPLADLAGVNLKAVKKMYIGVGSKTSPTPGGTGMLYIDDIGYGRVIAQ